MNRTERELLALEVDAIHGLEEGAAGIPATVKDPSVLAVYAWSPHARLLALGANTENPGHVGVEAQPYVPGEPPRVLTQLAGNIKDLGQQTVSVEGGPSYLFPERLAPRAPAPLPVIASDSAGRLAAADLVRPDNWQPGEWAELISGAVGEWAMAVHDNTPVSICFSPAANTLAAEAGTWTRADFRGRGLAPAVAAAWWHRERRNKQVLFYSTTAANHASQSVARALGLAPLGWIWTVR
ncbi:GNAT family N-acetyltransferase [Streptomyces sp. NPDC048644]|uniref:GNAT family N-acetyltransferase n=1 Tax=Streptomyces sp. NPDC048644 TaxID=3365582 RepID=UPI0037167A86